MIIITMIIIIMIIITMIIITVMIITIVIKTIIILIKITIVIIILEFQNFLYLISLHLHQCLRRTTVMEPKLTGKLLLRSWVVDNFLFCTFSLFCICLTEAALAHLENLFNSLPLFLKQF